MTTPPSRRFDFEFGGGRCAVCVGEGLLAGLGGLIAEALGRAPRAVFVIADEHVEPHAAAVGDSLQAAGCQVARASMVATEKTKTLETLGRLLGAMGAARVERADPVVAVGGGITGDVAGFAAASYRRGVPVVQCPTTLLSMVDASVGGKTGVNLDVGGVLQKNMVGAFWQPVLVVADTATLSTLPEREFRAGLAECVKHGLLDGCAEGADRAVARARGLHSASLRSDHGTLGHLEWIEANLDAILARDGAALTELIARSVAFKAAVVAGDEREMGEGGGRAVLNLGHTFAHAIETLPHLTPTGRAEDAPLLHGEAVSLGLVAAMAAGAATGRVDRALGERVEAVLRRCGLPVRVAGLPDDAALLSLMGADKKTSGGRLRLVLPEPGMRAAVVSGVDEGAIRAGWGAVRAP